MSKSIKLEDGREGYLVSQCNACGEFETIRSNGDCAGCCECYTIEDYDYVLVDNNDNVLGTERELLCLKN